MLRPTRVRLSVAIAVLVGIFLLTAAATALTGGVPTSHGRVVGTFDDIVLPPAWELAHQHLSGNLKCLDECPSATRTYWADGDLSAVFVALVTALENDAFDVHALPAEDPGDGIPPRRSLDARRGPVLLMATMVEGTTDTAVDHPPSTIPGRTAAIITLRVDTFVDGRYSP